MKPGDLMMALGVKKKRFCVELRSVGVSSWFAGGEWQPALMLL